MEDSNNEVSVAKFRLCAKRVFLTYDGYDGSLQSLLDFLHIKLDKCVLAEYAIAKDRGENNTKPCHVHAYIELQKSLDTRSARYFDYFDPIKKKLLHPNILRVKDRPNRNGFSVAASAPEGPWAEANLSMVEYVLHYVYDIENPELSLVSDGLRKKLRRNGSLMSVPEAVIDKALSAGVAAAMNLLYKEGPELYLTQYATIKENLQKIVKDKQVNIYDTKGVTIDTQSKDVLTQVYADVLKSKINAQVAILYKDIDTYAALVACLENIGPTFRYSNPLHLKSLPQESCIALYDGPYIKSTEEFIAKICNLIGPTDILVENEIVWTGDGKAWFFAAKRKSDAIKILKLKKSKWRPIPLLTLSKSTVLTSSEEQPT